MKNITLDDINHTNPNKMDLEAFFKITYGLYIISSKNGDQINGYIANTAFQVTAEPPQIAISCSKNNYTCQLIKSSERFSISILKEEARADLIGLFGYNSGIDKNKFESVEYIESKAGTPVVTDNCIAWFDCNVTKSIDVGSHMLFIATIEENELMDADGSPLTYAYYRDVKKGLAPKNAPTYIDKSKIEIPEGVANGLSKYKCLACGYIYDPVLGDPENGISPGTTFDELPDDWTCPTCGSPKSMFDKI